MSPKKPTIPSEHDLSDRLGRARKTWDKIVASIGEQHGPIAQEWKPSKSDFGRMCLLKQKKKTLLYLTPEEKTIVSAVVLGERAVARALEADLPEGIKTLLREARPYAEGRGIRFPVKSAADAKVVLRLVEIKLAPK